MKDSEDSNIIDIRKRRSQKKKASASLSRNQTKAKWGSYVQLVLLLGVMYLFMQQCGM